MRTVAFFLAVLSLMVFAAVLPHAVSIEQHSQDGLLNPLFVIVFLAGRKVALATSFMTTLVTWYVWFVVEWIERRLSSARNASGLECDPANDHAEPAAVRTLKDAIRGGDIEKVRTQLATLDELPEPPEGYFTPLELAELYGDPEIVARLRDYTEASLSAHEPESQTSSVVTGAVQSGTPQRSAQGVHAVDAFPRQVDEAVAEVA